MKNFLLPVILFCASLCCTALEIDPAKAVIVAPGSEKLAAGELQKHLKLITGVEIPIQGKADGQFAFTLGNPPSDAGLQPEEARWKVSRDGVHIYGGQRNGTAFAVYDFLEKQFKVRWIEPGDRGISYPEMKMLKLEETSGHWTPDGWRSAGYGMNFSHTTAIHMTCPDSSFTANRATTAICRRRCTSRNRNMTQSSKRSECGISGCAWAPGCR